MLKPSEYYIMYHDDWGEWGHTEFSIVAVNKGVEDPFDGMGAWKYESGPYNTWNEAETIVHELRMKTP
jgi:hypothetical protein